MFSLTGNAIHGIIRSSNDDGGECMERTENINRQQPLFLSFDEILPQDSMARVIDRFIDVCNLQQMPQLSAYIYYQYYCYLLYTSPSPRDGLLSRMPSS